MCRWKGFTAKIDSPLDEEVILEDCPQVLLDYINNAKTNLTPELTRLADEHFPTHTKSDLEGLPAITFARDFLFRNTPHRLTRTRHDADVPLEWSYSCHTDDDSDSPIDGPHDDDDADNNTNRVTNDADSNTKDHTDDITNPKPRTPSPDFNNLTDSSTRLSEPDPAPCGGSNPRAAAESSERSGVVATATDTSERHGTSPEVRTRPSVRGQDPEGVSNVGEHQLVTKRPNDYTCKTEV